MRAPSKPQIFWLLIILSVIAAVVVPGYAQRLRGAFQAVSLLQWPVTWVLGQSRPAGSEQSREAELRRENEAFQRQVVHLRSRVEQLQGRVDELSGLAGQRPAGHAVLVHAPIVGYDVETGRATLLIAKRNMPEWTRPGQWVVAGGAPVSDAAWDGPERVNRGWVVGVVTEVHLRVARVRLVSDPHFRTEVRAARVRGDGLELTPEGLLLRGTGGTSMEISQAPRNLLDAGWRIVMIPESPAMPFPMSVGWIRSAAPRRDSPQHFDLEVVPWSAVSSLTHVYVILVPGSSP